MDTATSSPNTCLSLSSSDLFASPTNSSFASWPSSPTAKRPAAAASPPPPRFFSSSCPSSPDANKRQHHSHFDQEVLLVDCTLSLGNAATRKSTEDAPSRLSRAGSPVEDRQHPHQQQWHWSRAANNNHHQHHQQQQHQQHQQDHQQHHQRQHQKLPNDLVSDPATRNLRTLEQHQHRQQRMDAAPDMYRHQVIAAHNSQFSPRPAAAAAAAAGAGLFPSKFGFLDFGSNNHGGFLDFNSSSSKHTIATPTSSDSCSTRSRFRDGHNDPRNVPRICAHCGTNSTPLWRNGPLGPKSLCNACGIRFKKVGRRSPVAGPGSSSVSSWALHQDFKNNGGAAVSARMPPVASPLAVQDIKSRNHIPFAREWSSSESPSSAVGSSCITWQENSTHSSACGMDTSANSRGMMMMRLLDERGGGSRFNSHPSPPPATAVALDAEVIRSVAPVADRRRDPNFLRMAL